MMHLLGPVAAIQLRLPITDYNSNLIEHRYKRNTWLVTYVSGTTAATHSHLFLRAF